MDTEAKIPSIAGGFIKPDAPADPAPSEFDPGAHAYGLYYDGKLIPVGTAPVVRQDGENVVVVFVTTADALRGLSKEAVLQKACAGWREGDVALVQEIGKVPASGTVVIEHFELPEDEHGEVMAYVRILTPILFSYQQNRRLGGQGTRIFVSLALLKRPPENQR